MRVSSSLRLAFTRADRKALTGMEREDSEESDKKASSHCTGCKAGETAGKTPGFSLIKCRTGAVASADTRVGVPGARDVLLFSSSTCEERGGNLESG